MSSFHFHRWAVIFLLVSKLILGEVTHAMPHMAEPATMLMNEAAPCGDHDASTEDHATKDCCKGGECACPGLHSPAVATAVSFTMQRSDGVQVAVLVEGAAWHRLSALFRPPA